MTMRSLTLQQVLAAASLLGLSSDLLRRFVLLQWKRHGRASSATQEELSLMEGAIAVALAAPLDALPS